MVRRARNEPLYRKVNTQTHGVHHNTGSNYRTERKAAALSEASRGSMHGKRKRGLDYTPLFMFLLSKVGVRIGESSYYSGLYVDDAGILQIVNPDLRSEDLTPHCICCTHTINGVRFGPQA